MTLCFIGLGNPGTVYKDTRHNIGFAIIDALVNRLQLQKFHTKFSGKILHAHYLEKKIILFKPELFMNNSGEAVRKLVLFYKLALQDIMVIHDDLEIAAQRVRIKCGGGSGGHNGIKSITNSIGSDYWRFRIGIGRPLYDDVAEYVLKRFNACEKIDLLIQRIVDRIDLLLQKDTFDRFINEINNSCQLV